MGLKQQQDLLARLYTDRATRDHFRDKPGVVAREFGLSEEESSDLSTISVAEVQWFADSLYAKRLREVKKLLPVSDGMIGEDFGPLFREFSAGFASTSVKKHLEDALAFAAWLLQLRKVEGAAADIVTFESVRLRHHATDRRLSICRLANDVRPLFGIGKAHPTEISARKCLAVWLSVAGRARFIFL